MPVKFEFTTVNTLFPVKKKKKLCKVLHVDEIKVYETVYIPSVIIMDVNKIYSYYLISKTC